MRRGGFGTRRVYGARIKFRIRTGFVLYGHRFLRHSYHPKKGFFPPKKQGAPPTRDHLAELVLLPAAAPQVGQPHKQQPQDGDPDPQPLAQLQAAPQKPHREEPGEDDDGTPKHLEAGGARHI